MPPELLHRLHVLEAAPQQKGDVDLDDFEQGQHLRLEEAARLPRQPCAAVASLRRASTTACVCSSWLAARSSSSSSTVAAAATPSSSPSG